MRWYCANCNHIVDEVSFHCTDLGTQVEVAVDAFNKSEERRKCKYCRVVADSATEPGEIEDLNINGGIRSREHLIMPS